MDLAPSSEPAKSAFFSHQHPAFYCSLRLVVVDSNVWIFEKPGQSKPVLECVIYCFHQFMLGRELGFRRVNDFEQALGQRFRLLAPHSLQRSVNHLQLMREQGANPLGLNIACRTDAMFLWHLMRYQFMWQIGILNDMFNACPLCSSGDCTIYVDAAVVWAGRGLYFPVFPR